MQIEQLLAWELQMKAVAEENELKREAGIRLKLADPMIQLWPKRTVLSSTSFTVVVVSVISRLTSNTRLTSWLSMLSS
jgi:hypothetical protein